MSLKTLSRVAFAIALIAIVAGSLAPNDWLSFGLAEYDRALHLVGYFVLAMLAALGWPRWRGWLLVGLPLVGLALEVAQDATGRSFEWSDALLNAAGIGIAVAASAVFTRWMTR